GEKEVPGGDEQTSREQRDQGIRNFQSVAKERRPELGSLLTSVLALCLAFFLGAEGDNLYNRGFRWSGRLVLASGPLLIVYAVFGLLLGLDPWSIWRGY